MSVVLQASSFKVDLPTEEVIVETNKSYDDVLPIIKKEASFYLIRGINVHNIALGSIWEILGSGIRTQTTRVEDTSCISILLAIGNALRRVFLFFPDATGSAVIAVLAFPFDRFRILPIVLPDNASTLPVHVHEVLGPTTGKMPVQSKSRKICNNE